MGDLKTFSIAAGLALTQPIVAMADQGLLYRFATCVGRLSAHMEHQWLMTDPGSDQTQASRAAMLDLLQAVRSDGDAVHVLDLRIQAKLAHASLLTRASFNSDPEDAAHAQRHADRALAACSALVLPQVAATGQSEAPILQAASEQADPAQKGTTLLK